jgi:hypothetical protein
MVLLFIIALFLLSVITLEDKVDYIGKRVKFSIILRISSAGVLKKARYLKRKEWKYLYKGRIFKYIDDYVDELIEFCSFVSRNKDSLHIVSDEIESICQEAEQIYLDLREYVVNPTVRRSLTRVLNKQDYTESDYRAYDMMKAVLENATSKTNNLKIQAKEILDKALENESVEIDKIVDNWENGISIVENNSDSSVSDKEGTDNVNPSNDDNRTKEGHPELRQNDLSNVLNEFSNPLWDENDTDDDEDSDHLISCSSVA